ncbi:MAG: TlpA family protein disulfide reductase [Candidatus Rokubacteria bacterium]|nr:TlpA family protein disulfide reductase [Candidatus Rokubacteria bacterium]
MPSALADVHREMKPRGLVVLPVSLQESRDTVTTWTRKVPLPFGVFLDEDAAMARAWRITSTPTVFLIDRRGRVVGKAVGTKPWSSPAGRALLTALLAS